MKKFKVGDQIVAREEHDYLGVEEGAIGIVVQVSGNDDGTQEVVVDFEDLDRKGITMDSSEIKLVARNPKYVKAFQVDVGDRLLTQEDESEGGRYGRERVREMAYIEEYDEIVFMTRTGYMNVSPTDSVLIEG